MDDIELKALVSAQIYQATGYLSSQITQEREEAMNFFLGEPFGDEVEGRSRVISRDVMDTIEWVMPALMEIFHGTEDPVKFEPEGPEDEEHVDQATDYVNHIYNKDNQGFLNSYEFIKDALLQKVGIAKTYWDERTKITEETRQGLSAEELALLEDDDEVEILEEEEIPLELDPAQEAAMAEMEAIKAANPNAALPDLPKPVEYKVKLRRTQTIGRVKVEIIAPEHFLIHKGATHRDIYPCGHRVQRTRSELVAMGYDKDFVWSLPTDEDEDDDLTGEGDARFPDEEDNDIRSTRVDEAERPVLITEWYLRVDYDGDGISELRRVVVAGTTGAELMERDGEPEIDVVDDTTWALWSPVLVPHTVWGLSQADLVKDLQLLKSTIWRQMMDNLYLTNNPSPVIVDGQVNIDDLLQREPGKPVRAKAPGMIDWGGAIPFVAQHGFAMIDHCERVREMRTGVSQTQMGVDPDLLHNVTAAASNQAMTAAQQRIKLLARVLAELGFKRIFRNILKIAAKYQDKERVIRLRNNWVPMDPRGWNPEMDMSVMVGLGTGNKTEQLMHLSTILQQQKEGMAAGGAGGMVTWKKIHNTLDEMVKTAGFAGVDKFFDDPDGPEAQQRMAMQAQQQQQSDPAAMMMQVEMAKMQVDMAKLQLDAQKAQAQVAQDREEARMKVEQRREEVAAELTLKEELAAAEMRLEERLARMRLAAQPLRSVA